MADFENFTPRTYKNENQNNKETFDQLFNNSKLPKAKLERLEARERLENIGIRLETIQELDYYVNSYPEFKGSNFYFQNNFKTSIPNDNFAGSKNFNGISNIDYRPEKKLELSGPLEGEGQFREIYGDFTKKIEQQLALPKGIVNGIIKKESTFGTNLVSRTGARGMMQLTSWPLRDMRGDIGTKRIGVDNRRVENYMSIFQQMNFNELKNIDIGEGHKIIDTLDAEIWNNLEDLGSGNISAEKAKDIISDFFIKIRNDKTDFYHTLNIILGSVYFRYKLKGNSEKSIKNALVAYNGDPKVKYQYSRQVFANMREEQRSYYA